MKKTSKFFLAFTICIFQANLGLSSSIEKAFLDEVELKFDRCKSKEEQHALVTQIINIDVLKSADSLENLDRDALSKGVGSQPFFYNDSEESKAKFYFFQTNPIAIAIALGDFTRFEKFISVVEDVNNPFLASWGYRQPYFLTHVALDPIYHKSYSSKGAPLLRNRLEIVHLLAQKGGDFNISPSSFTMGVYDNPPLVAAGLNGKAEFTDDLRARALLYGADPCIKGSSKSLVCINPTEDRPLDSFGYEANRLVAIAFKFLLTEGKPSSFVIAPSVKEAFKELKDERQRKLDALTF